MNYVAIDPSLSCTAMVVNDKKFVYTTSTVAHTKKGGLKRWFSECEAFATIRVFDSIPDGDYSDLEMLKLIRFQHIAATIVDDIVSNIDLSQNIHVAIEGYSYSSAAGPLIDLVTFGTLLRHNLSTVLSFEVVSRPTLFDIQILAPTQVKRYAAQIAYPPTSKGKKVEYRNNDGVAGGSFKKKDIFKALIDNPNLKGDTWIEYLRENAEEILDLRDIPKPIEDLDDAKTIYEIIKSGIPLDK